MSLYINTTLIPTAFLITSVVFVSFTLAALYTKQAQFLYLGGILGSGLSVMCILSLANLFFRSRMIFQVRGKREGFLEGVRQSWRSKLNLEDLCVNVHPVTYRKTG